MVAVEKHLQTSAYCYEYELRKSFAALRLLIILFIERHRLGLVVLIA